MVTTIVTHDTGGMLKPGPMLTVQPNREQTDDELSGVAGGSGLNGPFVADLLSACVMHERMGVPLFRALGAMTANPAVQPKFAQYRKETEQAVAVWEELITALGGDPQYVSPPARMTESMDSHLLMSLQSAGSADPVTIDLKLVECVLVAATVCVDNVALVGKIADEAKDGAAKTAMVAAVEQLKPAALKHLEWARETQQFMVVTTAKHPVVQKVGNAVESVVSKGKNH